ncbi:MAG: uracil-DNA glycosylase [Alphaproteobacteria bacterium]|nr:uracil-DNA glycosylase [Alphaproteobacteria bacterium]
MEDITDIQNILQFYISAGVDQTCGDDICLLKKDVQQPQTAPLLRPATTRLAQDMTASRQNARELCTKAETLDELRQLVCSFDGCALKLTAKSTVFGDGNKNADVMIIGEAPGADEDRIGLPFVGRSGRLLEKMLAAIGLKREDVYITNVLPWRPPGNRTPTDAEIAVCLPFLKRQIELINPKIILLLGGSAANAVLDNADSISRLRGHFLDYTLSTTTVIPALASFHPAFLLRNSAQKAKAWTDFLRLFKKLKEN